MPDVSIQIDPLSAAVAVTSLVLTLRMQRKTRQVGRRLKKQASQKSLLRPRFWMLRPTSWTGQEQAETEKESARPLLVWPGQRLAAVELGEHST
jgi:hypothetical protein